MLCPVTTTLWSLDKIIEANLLNMHFTAISGAVPVVLGLRYLTCYHYL